MTPQEVAQVTSAVVALVAVIVGPAVSLRVAKRQMLSSRAIAELQARANVLSKTRQEWINNLRQEVASFITTIEIIVPLMFAQKDTAEMSKQVSQMYLQLNRIRLLINPDEDDHSSLVKIMQEVAIMVTSCDRTAASRSHELTSLSQKILKREWERVKSFT